MGLDVVQPFRFCNKCQTLFFEGKYEPAGTPKGLCPAGGAHVAQGYEFRLPVHANPSPTAQNRWRHCETCWVMYYDGYPEKGRCPGNPRGHRRETRFNFNFALPHDIPATSTSQSRWRICGRCHAMHYDGYPGKGRCAAGGGHVAQGYDFVLPHLRHRNALPERREDLA